MQARRNMSYPLPSSPRVLIVDDHRRIREPLAIILRKNKFDVRTAENAEGMNLLMASTPFDLVVLDVMLPDGDGFVLCQQVSQQHQVPVILLTAKDTAADRIHGLNLGADDYLTKPFEPMELVARINSVLRRTRRSAPPSPPPALKPRHYRFGGVSFDPVTATLSNEVGLLVNLGTSEGKLFQVFLDHPCIALTREQLIALTSPSSNEVSEVFDRTIDRQVSRIRRKLCDLADLGQALRTVRNGGYLLALEVEVSER